MGFQELSKALPHNALSHMPAEDRAWHTWLREENGKQQPLQSILGLVLSELSEMQSPLNLTSIKLSTTEFLYHC